MPELHVLEKLGILEVAKQASTVSCDLLPQGHSLSTHTPVWAFVDPRLGNPYADPEGTRPLFAPVDPGDGLGAILEKTSYVVLLGACRSTVYNALEAQPRILKLVFEPNLDRFRSFLRGTPTSRLASSNTFFFVGPADGFCTSVSGLLPYSLVALGFPVFFLQDGLAAQQSEYVSHVIEQVEMHYYRHAIYHIEGQANLRGLPLRPMTRGLFFDQQKHLYENLHAMVTGGNLAELEGTAKGASAMLVGAGPGLDEHINYIKKHARGALVISVNSALKPLLRFGIEPHFVVINDTSLGAEPTLSELPALPRTTLVAHCLSATGNKAFASTRFFGNVPPGLFPLRPDLRLHGSVITTAFSLARFLGCTRCVLIGINLLSHDPWQVRYSPLSLQDSFITQEERTQKLPGCYPQLYPTKNSLGEARYTSLNFKDVSLWFLDEIRASGIEVINRSEDSLLYGPGIIVDPNYELPGLDTAPHLERLVSSEQTVEALEKVTAYVAGEITIWKRVLSVALHVSSVASQSYEQLEPSVQRIISEFDCGNISYLLQRFEDFNNPFFHKSFFDSADVQGRRKGALYYFSYLKRMADFYLAILRVQRRRLAGR